MIKINGYKVSEDKKYTKDHIWVNVIDKDTMSMGITDYFIKKYRNIQSIEFPQVGSKVIQNKSIGKIETVKGTTELYAAISGEVKKVNKNFLSQLMDITEEPYEKGWILTIESSNLTDEEEYLLSAEGYASYLKKLVEAGL